MKLRFSLRTLLIVTTLACIAIVVVGGPFRIYYAAERHRKALAHFDHMPFLHDGFVHIQNGRWINAPPSKSRWVDFARQRIHPLAYVRMSNMYVASDWSASRDKFKEFRNLVGLQEISAFIDSFSMEDAKNLNAIPELNACIFKTLGPVEPGAMELLTGNRRMKKFILHPIGLETCKAISKNTSLIEVGVGGQGFTIEHLEVICKSRSIERLILFEVKCDADMIAAIGQLKQLKELELFDTGFDAAELEEVSKLALESVIIDMLAQELSAPITILAQNPNLRKLEIRKPFPRTEGDLASFAKCPNLELLKLSECVIDAESLAMLGKIPSLKIATFSGNLANEVAQVFVDSVPGRELTLYTNGFRESHKPGGKRIFVCGKPMATQD